MSSFDVIFREAARERGIQPRRHENEVSSTSLIPLSLIEFALENPMPKTERNHSEVRQYNQRYIFDNEYISYTYVLTGTTRRCFHNQKTIDLRRCGMPQERY